MQGQTSSGSFDSAAHDKAVSGFAQDDSRNKQRRRTSNGEEQATAKNKQRRRTNNGEEQTTAKNKQRRRTSNGEEQATAKCGGPSTAAAKYAAFGRDDDRFALFGRDDGRCYCALRMTSKNKQRRRIEADSSLRYGMTNKRTGNGGSKTYFGAIHRIL